MVDSEQSLQLPPVYTQLKDLHLTTELVREGEILHRGQKIFLPDFLLRHSGGTEVLLEIAGFWTPEYLAEKKRTLEIFGDRRILIAIPETMLQKYGLPAEIVVPYKTRLEVEPVMKAIENLHLSGTGG